MPKEERVCQFYKLATDKNGDIFPCCLYKSNTKLGNIFDNDIIEKIKTTNITCECVLFKAKKITPDDKIDIKKLHLMFSNVCQGKCVCCFQKHDDKIQNEEKYKERLSYFIEQFKPEFITVLGGEVLIQPNILSWLEKIKKNHPAISFDIITNLCVNEVTIKRAEKIFNEMTVSMLGFSENTYNKVMGLNFKTTIKNFNYLKQNTNIKLRPKYLTMPTNVYELPLFLSWALNQKIEKIYLHNNFEFYSCCNLTDSFWQKTFAQIEEEIKKIILDKKEYIISQNKHFISFHSLLAKMLKINNKFLEDNNFNGIIKIT